MEFLNDLIRAIFFGFCVSSLSVGPFILTLYVGELIDKWEEHLYKVKTEKQGQIAGRKTLKAIKKGEFIPTSVSGKVDFRSN